MGAIDASAGREPEAGTGERTPGPEAGLRTLVVGAGAAGSALVRDLLRTPEFGLVPVGLLDDDPRKIGTALLGLPVTGPLAGLTEIATRHRAEVVALAIPGLPPQEVRRLATAAGAMGASVRYLPSFLSALRREVVGTDMRALDVGKLIGRNEVHVAGPDIR